MTFDEFVAANLTDDAVDDLIAEGEEAGWRMVPPEAFRARLLDLLNKAWEAGHEAGYNAYGDLEEAGW